MESIMATVQGGFMRRVFWLFLFAVLCAPQFLAQSKHPFTFEDMMKLKRVGEP
jgi:hypothetical protein